MVGTDADYDQRENSYSILFLRFEWTKVFRIPKQYGMTTMYFYSSIFFISQVILGAFFHDLGHLAGVAAHMPNMHFEGVLC